jgi:hypothetical protein
VRWAAGSAILKLRHPLGRFPRAQLPRPIHRFRQPLVSHGLQQVVDGAGAVAHQLPMSGRCLQINGLTSAAN